MNRVLDTELGLQPQWPAPSHVKAMTTLRCYSAGVSQPPYERFNLADHVGDSPEHVSANRMLLNTPSEPVWLKQTHSTIVVDAAAIQAGAVEADASFSGRANTVCVVMTADCLPLLVTNPDGSEVAAIHAGWRGLAKGIIEQTLAQMASPAEELLVWLGPGIGADVYEVGQDVRDAFITHDPAAVEAFARTNKNKWLADMYTLARQRLQKCRVSQIYGGEYCTYSEPERFYSYRRDGITGRMASLIWFENN